MRCAVPLPVVAVPISAKAMSRYVKSFVGVKFPELSKSRPALAPSVGTACSVIPRAIEPPGRRSWNTRAKDGGSGWHCWTLTAQAAWLLFGRAA